MTIEIWLHLLTERVHDQLESSLINVILSSMWDRPDYVSRQMLHPAQIAVAERLCCKRLASLNSKLPLLLIPGLAPPHLPAHYVIIDHAHRLAAVPVLPVLLRIRELTGKHC